MWNPVRVLISQAQEIASLLAEQNSLLRELIQAQTHRVPQTPIRKGSGAEMLIPPKPPGPIRTAKDVWNAIGEPPTTEDQARLMEVRRKMERAAAQEIPSSQAQQAQEIPPTPV